MCVSVILTRRGFSCSWKCQVMLSHWAKTHWFSSQAEIGRLPTNCSQLVMLKTVVSYVLTRWLILGNGYEMEISTRYNLYEQYIFSSLWLESCLLYYLYPKKHINKYSDLLLRLFLLLNLLWTTLNMVHIHMSQI